MKPSVGLESENGVDRVISNTQRTATGQRDDDEAPHDETKSMEDFVTSGCIPCELRRLFVEALHNNAESTAKTGISVGGQLTSAQEGTTVKSLDNVGGTGVYQQRPGGVRGGTANSPRHSPK